MGFTVVSGITFVILILIVVNIVKDLIDGIN